MSTPIVAGSLLAAALLAASGMLASSRPSAPPASEPRLDPPAGRPTAPPPARVQTATPTRRTLEQWVDLPGTLSPYFSATLYAKESGYVGRVLVDIGDRVNAGDPLLTLDVPEMADEMRHARATLAVRQAELADARAREAHARQAFPRARAEARQVEAELNLREITARRKEALGADQVIAPQELDEARAALAVAREALAVARARMAEMDAEMLVYHAAVAVREGAVAEAEASIARMETLAKYTTITAPFDAVVTRRFVDPGAFVRSAGAGAASPVLELAVSDRLRLVVEVAEPDAPFVRPGSRAQFTIGAETRSAQVSRTAAALRTDTRTMRAEIDLDNSDSLLLPGAYVKVRLALLSRPDALVLPAQALRSSPTGAFVLIDQAGVATETPVGLGYNDGVLAEILSGLRGDEKVIIAAASAVKPGSPVESVPLPTDPGATP